MPKLFLHGLLLCLGVLVSVLLGEILIRAAFPQQLVRAYFIPNEDVGNVLRPNQTYVDHYGEYGRPYTVKTNSVGLRMNEDVDPAPDTTKVLALGDSFTFGWGVEVQESFFGILSQTVHQYGKYQLLNGGVGASSTGHSIKRLSYYSTLFDFDAVIYFLNPNDLIDNFNRDPNYRVTDFTFSSDGTVSLRDTKVYTPLKRWLLHQPLYVWLNQHSHLFIFLKSRVRGGSQLTEPAMGFKEPATERKALEMAAVSLAYMRRLLSVLDKMRKPLMVIPIPSPMEFNSRKTKGPSVYEPFKEDAADVCQTANHCYFFDPKKEMKTILQEANLSIKEIYFSDGHYNRRGNQIFAKAVKDLLLQQILNMASKHSFQSFSPGAEVES